MGNIRLDLLDNDSQIRFSPKSFDGFSGYTFSQKNLFKTSGVEIGRFSDFRVTLVWW